MAKYFFILLFIIKTGCGSRTATSSSSIFLNDPNSTNYAEFIDKYTERYFHSVISEKYPPIVRPYRIHKHDPVRGKINHIALKNLESYSKLNMMRVDFSELNMTKSNSDDNIDKYLKMEMKLRKRFSGNEMEANKEVLKLTLEKVLSSSRHISNRKSKNSSGWYIYKRMGLLGLIMYSQTFGRIPLLDSKESSINTSGSNIIGIIPGIYWNSTLDRPIILGAHWDTVQNSTGTNDNASGVAALLEIASVLAKSKCFKNKYSIIFVAFDSEEAGSYGSLEFIRAYLKPDFLEKGVEISGVFILDTILNYDNSVESQLIPLNWDKFATETSERIRGSNYKGDFIAVINRDYHKEKVLGANFVKYFNILKSNGFKNDSIRSEHISLKGMPIHKPPSIKTMNDHLYFWRSDHSRFWYYTDDLTPSFTSLSAVLITDTALHRGYMKQCYHKFCDNPTNQGITTKSFDFLTIITQALIFSISELSRSDLNQCEIEKTLLRKKKIEIPKSKSCTTIKTTISSTSTTSTKSTIITNTIFSQFDPWINVESYQPNYGNQFNIGNLNLDMGSIKDHDINDNPDYQNSPINKEKTRYSDDFLVNYLMKLLKFSTN